MKITYSSENINSFGGINFADHIVSNASVYKTIDQTLGGRGLKAEYPYSGLVRSYLLMVLCGGECAEDITEHFNINMGMDMNKLLVRLAVQTGQLSPKNDNYIFDYDNQFIPTDKYDSKRSYKHADGYFPGIASIGNFPVYIENRNGNSNVKYKQDETLERAYEVLGENGIKVKHSRMDRGPFGQTVVPVVEANSTYFYIRAQRCASLYDMVKNITYWKTELIGFKEYQVTSIEYAPFGWDKTYRYVITREKKGDKQGDLFTGDDIEFSREKNQ